MEELIKEFREKLKDQGIFTVEENENKDIILKLEYEKKEMIHLLLEKSENLLCILPLNNKKVSKETGKGLSEMINFCERYAKKEKIKNRFYLSYPFAKIFEETHLEEVFSENFFDVMSDTLVDAFGGFSQVKLTNRIWVAKNKKTSIYPFLKTILTCENMMKQMEKTEDYFYVTSINYRDFYFMGHQGTVEIEWEGKEIVLKENHLKVTVKVDKDQIETSIKIFFDKIKEIRKLKFFFEDDQFFFKRLFSSLSSGKTISIENILFEKYSLKEIEKKCAFAVKKGGLKKVTESPDFHVYAFEKEMFITDEEKNKIIYFESDKEKIMKKFEELFLEKMQTKLEKAKQAIKDIKTK